MKNTTVVHLGFVIALALGLGWSMAQGAPIYDSGTASIVHDADLAVGGAPEASVASFAIPPYPPSPLQYPSNVLSKTVDEDTSTSTAEGGIGEVTWPTVFGLAFPGGTGVEQDDTAGLFTASASLLFTFTATWDIDVGGFGPPLWAGAVFPLEGEVGSGGGSVELRVSASFASATHGSLRDPITNPLYSNSTPGPFFIGVSDLVWVVPPKDGLPDGDVVTISGTVEFRAKSGSGGPSSIRIPGGEYAGIPEPCTIVLLALAAPALIRRRRRG